LLLLLQEIYDFNSNTADDQWVDVYGRVLLDGINKTIVPSACPSGQLGRVLHPTEHRSCSLVFRFGFKQCSGSTRLNHNLFAKKDFKKRFNLKQVVNAVPPPMGRAIVQEILKNLR
jgi:hypothetical protein